MFGHKYVLRLRVSTIDGTPCNHPERARACIGMYTIPSTNRTKALWRFYTTFAAYDRRSDARHKCCAGVLSAKCGVYVCVCVMSLSTRYGTLLPRTSARCYTGRAPSTASTTDLECAHEHDWYVCVCVCASASACAETIEESSPHNRCTTIHVMCAHSHYICII